MIQALIGVMMIILIIILLWIVKMYIPSRKIEKFASNGDILEKIRRYISEEKNAEYIKDYIHFALANNILEKEYLGETFFYGAIALKKLNILTNQNLEKIL